MHCSSEVSAHAPPHRAGVSARSLSRGPRPPSCAPLRATAMLGASCVSCPPPPQQGLHAETVTGAFRGHLSDAELWGDLCPQGLSGCSPGPSASAPPLLELTVQRLEVQGQGVVRAAGLRAPGRVPPASSSSGGLLLEALTSASLGRGLPVRARASLRDEDSAER